MTDWGDLEKWYEKTMDDPRNYERAQKLLQDYARKELEHGRKPEDVVSELSTISGLKTEKFISPQTGKEVTLGIAPDKVSEDKFLESIARGYDLGKLVKAEYAEVNVMENVEQNKTWVNVPSDKIDRSTVKNTMGFLRDEEPETYKQVMDSEVNRMRDAEERQYVSPVVRQVVRENLIKDNRDDIRESAVNLRAEYAMARGASEAQAQRGYFPTVEGGSTLSRIPLGAFKSRATTKFLEDEGL